MCPPKMTSMCKTDGNTQIYILQLSASANTFSLAGFVLEQAQFQMRPHLHKLLWLHFITDGQHITALEVAGFYRHSLTALKQCHPKNQYKVQSSYRRGTSIKIQTCKCMLAHGHRFVTGPQTHEGVPILIWTRGSLLHRVPKIYDTGTINLSRKNDVITYQLIYCYILMIRCVPAPYYAAQT